VELHHSIQPAIPQFIGLLKDKHPDVQSAATLVLAKLAGYRECQLDIIAALLMRS